MKIKGVRILKKGVKAGYVKQKDGKWKFRFLKKKKKIVGGEFRKIKEIEINKIELPKDLIKNLYIFFVKIFPKIKNNNLIEIYKKIFKIIYDQGIFNKEKEEKESRLPSNREYAIPAKWNEMNEYEPIKVIYSFGTDTYKLIDGRHRLFKLLLLGKKTVYACVTYPT